MRSKLVIIAVMLSVLVTGCSSGKTSYRSIRAESMLTTQEVLDYYSRELSYESIVQYSNLNNEVLEYNTVSGNMKEKATEAYRDIIKDYRLNSDYGISRNKHEYLKAFIDDLVIDEKEIVSIKEAMGYYYVEVDYTTSPNKLGQIKENANYLGISGLIIEDYNGDTLIDEDYLTVAIDEINKHRELNGLGLLDSKGNKKKNSDTSNSVGMNIGNANNVRRLSYDIKEFNEVVGSSKDQIAIMPTIDLVFEPTNITGTANGYGIFNAGNYGLKDFGYVRGGNKGNLKITYVFKQNEVEGKRLDYQFCFINSYSSNIKIGDEEETMVPNFVRTELEKVLERYDRAVNNRDIAALMSGDIVEDAGLGLLSGLYGDNSQIINFISNIKSVITRDNKTYLLELERTVEDCARGTGVTTVYEDTYYAVIRQDDLLFKINDVVLKSREVKRVPEPNPDNASYRRLVALNLAGQIKEDQKDGIKDTLQGLYAASTERSLGEMYDKFNSNKELLGEERLEYINSKLRSYLTYYGVSQEAVMSGKVTAWIGGYDTQAEVTTEELIEYTGTDNGKIIKCYYLMSNYGTQWVIDDIEVMSDEDVSGLELSDAKSRLAD